MKYFLWLGFLWLVSCQSNQPEVITIATAANMQYAIDEIRKVFTDQTGIPTEVVISSSGKLSTQALQGAPFDVFVSADTVYPYILYRNKMASQRPLIYGYGSLVIWSVNRQLTWSKDIFQLNANDKIAIPNPAIAPYGEAAVDVLKKQSNYDQLSERLVFGESVSQTNQYILSGSVVYGFTALSVVLAPQLVEKGSWISVPDHLYYKIPQAAVVITQDPIRKQRAEQFLTFLVSQPAQEILANFGYIDPRLVN